MYLSVPGIRLVYSNLRASDREVQAPCSNSIGGPQLLWRVTAVGCIPGKIFSRFELVFGRGQIFHENNQKSTAWFLTLLYYSNICLVPGTRYGYLTVGICYRWYILPLVQLTVAGAFSSPNAWCSCCRRVPLPRFATC